MSSSLLTFCSHSRQLMVEGNLKPWSQIHLKTNHKSIWNRWSEWGVERTHPLSSKIAPNCSQNCHKLQPVVKHCKTFLRKTLHQRSWETISEKWQLYVVYVWDILVKVCNNALICQEFVILSLLASSIGSTFCLHTVQGQWQRECHSCWSLVRLVFGRSLTHCMALNWSKTYFCKCCSPPQLGIGHSLHISGVNS